MDRRVIELYDEYTHRPLERRVFLQRLASLVGGSAAAYALLPMLENNYARAAIVDPTDARLATGMVTYRGASGEVRGYVATPKAGAAKRPGVIVSSDAYHQSRRDVILIAVTSQILRSVGTPGEVLIENWQTAGLPKASLIKPVLATIEQRLILRKLGALHEADVHALRSALRQIIG